MEENVIKILRNCSEEILNYTGPNMVDDEIIDSFSLISLISDLEEAFGIEIDAEYITEENFGNKECIIKLMKKLTGN